MNTGTAYEALILASGSPRRQQILRQMGLPFTVLPAHIDETIENVSPEQNTVDLAREKAETVRKRYKNEFSTQHWIVGADTVIVLDNAIIGKPADRDDARRILTALSGRSHSVVTGIALTVENCTCTSLPRMETAAVRTEVSFAALEPEEIDWYLDTGEWQGAAGGYRIQGKGACFITRIEGSYSNVIGLPINTFYGMLKRTHYTGVAGIYFPPSDSQ